MTDIIKFQEYVNARNEEKKRIKQISILSTKSQDIVGLLKNIDNSVGCSFVTRHFNEMNQIVGKENIIDSATIDVIANSLKDYNNKICEKIKELNCFTNIYDTDIHEV